VPGRSGAVYKQWLTDCGKTFTSHVQVTALDPFHGYKDAIDDELEDAVAVLDRVHVHVRPRRWSTTCAAASSKRPPGTVAARATRSTGSATPYDAPIRNLTDRQRARHTRAFTADPAHEEVFWAWRLDGELRVAYDHPDPRKGRDRARRLQHTLRACPIPEARRLGNTLRRWRDAFLAYWTEHGPSNGGAEAMNNLIELHRRIARGIPNADHYRLRMLLMTALEHLAIAIPTRQNCRLWASSDICCWRVSINRCLSCRASWRSASPALRWCKGVDGVLVRFMMPMSARPAPWLTPWSRRPAHLP
jgi:transposase